MSVIPHAHPEHLDPWRAVRSGVHLAGRIRLETLPRLVGLLHEAGDGGAADVEYRLEFGRDPGGRALIRGKVRSVLPLRCERCLGTVQLAVDSTPRLALLHVEQEADDLPDDLDPLVISDEPLCVTDLIEDELLLAIPAVPRHAAGACRPPADLDAMTVAEAPAADATENPFAMLASLRGVRRD